MTYGFTKGDLPKVNGKLNPQIFADADHANDPDHAIPSQAIPTC